MTPVLLSLIPYKIRKFQDLNFYSVPGKGCEEASCVGLVLAVTFIS